MSALLEFADWVKAAGPSVAAGAARDGTHDQEQSAQLQAEVTKRLAALLGPCKEAMSNNGPAAAQVHSYLDAVKKHVSHRDFEQAAQDLDKLEALVGESKPSNSGIGADDGKPAAGANPSTPGSPSAAEAGSEADVACAPPATSTDLFFGKDSAELTGHQPGVRDLFGPQIRKRAILVIFVCALSLTGHWAFLFWFQQHLRNLPDVVNWTDQAKTEYVSLVFQSTGFHSTTNVTLR
jgi:hypothetical protein